MNAAHITTARFWVWHIDGWVRLQLRDGDTATLRSGGGHEEGWTHTLETYRRDGDVITCEADSRWLDCDGPGGRESDSWCPVLEVRSRLARPDCQAPGPLPMWRAGGSTITDVYAQQAGY